LLATGPPSVLPSRLPTSQWAANRRGRIGERLGLLREGPRGARWARRTGRLLDRQGGIARRLTPRGDARLLHRSTGGTHRAGQAHGTGRLVARLRPPTQHGGDRSGIAIALIDLGRICFVSRSRQYPHEQRE